jgi:hypothetical protein
MFAQSTGGEVVEIARIVCRLSLQPRTIEPRLNAAKKTAAIIKAFMSRFYTRRVYFQDPALARLTAGAIFFVRINGSKSG